MKTTSKHNWKGPLGKILLLICVSSACVEGALRKTTYFRNKGGMSLPITCAIDAQSVDNLAVKYDGANSCENLGWEWGHTYDGVSTYFEKQHVVEVFDEPMVLGGSIRLPIVFNEGAFINMHIEFTSFTFTNAFIDLVDILNVYGGESGHIFMRFTMIRLIDGDPQLFIRTWNGGWVTRGFILPFPFTTGIVYKLTIKALEGGEFQVLVDNEEYTRYPFQVPSSTAKNLQISDDGMLLHKIEFVA